MPPAQHWYGQLAQPSACWLKLQPCPAPPHQQRRISTHAGKGIKAPDTNNDKMILRDEAQGKSRLTKNFDAIDMNKDGQSSRDELKAHRSKHKSKGKGQVKS